MTQWYEWQEAPAADFGVIGDPVSHSLSPKMHRAAYAHLGLDYVYTAVRVPQGDFGQAVERLTGLGYKGLNVTVPLKQVALEWCEWTNAERYGAVNALDLVHRGGTNTDAPGFLETLADAGVKPCSTLVLGAGGSSRAICVALDQAGFGVKLWSRTREKAEGLVAATGIDVEIVDSTDPSGCELLVNATSMGIEGLTVSIDWGKARESVLAYDLWYTEGLTPFLAEAAVCGRRTQDGRAMLVAQGALSFEWWTGLEAPRTAMMDAVQ